MNRTAKRISFLQGCFALALALVVLRAGQLQLVEGSYWSEQAESRRTARDTLEARRGSIYDRRGVQLAVTQEFYHVGIAPNEVKDTPRAWCRRRRAHSTSAPVSCSGSCVPGSTCTSTARTPRPRSSRSAG